MAPTTVTTATPIIKQLDSRPGTLTTIPATEITPEIEFLDSDIETSYSFLREDGNQVGLVLTHAPWLHKDHELHLAVLDPADDNYDVVEEVHLRKPTQHPIDTCDSYLLDEKACAAGQDGIR